jgi:hypothetical protein
MDMGADKVNMARMVDMARMADMADMDSHMLIARLHYLMKQMKQEILSG